MTADLGELGTAKYVLLTTFRRDGSAVPTPVWAAPDGGRLLVWTETHSYKVKRIRRNPRVTLAACDMRGNPKGEPVEASAQILDAAGTDHVRALIARKYGILGRIIMKASLIRRGRDGTIGLAITPA